MIVEFVILGVLTLFLNWCFNIYTNNKKLQSIPGPTPIPFFGFKFTDNVFEIKEYFDELVKTYGPTFKFYLGPQLTVATGDADLLQAIVQNPVEIKKSNLYDLARAWVKDGIVVSSGQKWTERRKLTNPAFHLSILKEFFNTFNKDAIELIDCLSKAAHDEEEEVNLQEYMSRYTLDVLTKTVFGVNLNIQKGENCNYTIAANKMLHLLHVRNLSIWKRNDLLFKLFAKEYKEQEECIHFLESTSMEIIKRRRKEADKNTDNTEETNDAKKRMILLDILLQHKELSDNDIDEEIQNFMFAGFDTTASGLSCALIELSRHQDIQEKLYQEIVYHLQDNVNNLSYEALNKMTYLDQVVKESMRLRPPIVAVQREMTNDVNYAGTVYPKGTVFILLFYWLHNNSKYYPDPEKFDPERFSPENVEKRHPFAYLPFSAGPRNCIGQKFALLEMKTALVRILCEFKVLPIKNLKIEIGFTGVIKYKDGFKVRLQKRS